MGKKNNDWVSVSNPISAMKGLEPGEALIYRPTNLRVIETTEVLDDKRRYMHLSISHPDRYPTWEELLMVKERFVGDEEEAIQVLPRKSEYVNIHPNCFHLWFCYDGNIIGG